MSNPRLLHLSAIYDESTEAGRAAVEKATAQRNIHAGNNPRWQIKLWRADESRELVERLRPDLLETYDGYGHNVQRSDMARVLALKASGGMYMDLDYTVAAKATADADPLDRVFNAMFEADVSASAAVNSTPNTGTSSNSLLAARGPNDPFWDLYLDEMKSHSGSWKKISHHFHVLKSTGPARLDSTLRKARKLSGSVPMPAIAPTDSLNPCGTCSRKSCKSGTNVLAYHIADESWNSGRYFWHFCQCEWPWVLGVGLGLIFIIILAVVLFKGSNCKPCAR